MLQHLNNAASDTEVMTEETSGGSLTNQRSIGTEQTKVVSAQTYTHTVCLDAVSRCHICSSIAMSHITISSCHTSSYIAISKCHVRT